jgi:hypothetical protein
MEPKCYYRLLTTSKSRRLTLRETWMAVLSNPTDADAILSRINNAKMQLTIRIVVQDTHLAQHFMNLPSHKLLSLKTNQVSDWQTLSEKHTVIATFGAPESITDIFPRISSHLKELQLSNYNKLTEVFSLAGLSKLILRGCPSITKVDCLQHLTFLEFHYCQGLSDVSKLGKVKTLILSDCFHITTIATLTDNEKLTILGCTSINRNTIDFRKIRYLYTDLLQKYEETTNLPNCYSLNLSGYSDNLVFTNYPGLRKLHLRYKYEDLLLHDFDLLDRNNDSSFLNNLIPFDFSSFSTHLFAVKLVYFPHKKLDLTPLYSIPVVKLCNFFHLQSLQGLGGNRFVTIDSCHNIRDFSALTDIPRVEINCCDQFVSCTEGFANVSDLTIRSCIRFSDTSGLKNTKHLKITHCSALKELKDVQDISTVTILLCSSLESLNG